MNKIFKITYNDGGWHTGGLPYFFYIAKNKEEVITNSKQYQNFSEMCKFSKGDIWIDEVNLAEDTSFKIAFENLTDFNIEISIKEKL